MKLDQFGETKSSTANASTSGWPRKLSKFQGASLVFGVLTAIALLAIGMGAGDLVSRDEFERWERHKKLSYLEAILLARSRGRVFGPCFWWILIWRSAEPVIEDFWRFRIDGFWTIRWKERRKIDRLSRWWSRKRPHWMLGSVFYRAI